MKKNTILAIAASALAIGAALPLSAQPSTPTTLRTLTLSSEKLADAKAIAGGDVCEKKVAKDVAEKRCYKGGRIAVPNLFKVG